jgi:hypothetical protein
MPGGWYPRVRRRLLSSAISYDWSWPTAASQPADLNDRSRDIAAIGGGNFAGSEGVRFCRCHPLGARAP